MKCKECEKEGQESVLRICTKVIETMLMPEEFYDKEGLYHHHDGTCTKTEYSCSRGHFFSESILHRCSACGWKKKEDR